MNYLNRTTVSLTTTDDGAAFGDRWPTYALVLAFAVIWFAFSWPWLSGAVTIPWDGKAHFAPQVQFMAASIARGEWPWWSPNVFAGHPQIADPQSMLFSPPFILLAVLDPSPGPWAIDLVVLLMLLAAGLATLWLARDLNWHWLGAIVAAVGLAFGAAMAWRLQHFGQVLSLAYLPFAMLFLRRAILRPSIGHGALAGLFAAFIVLGRDQVGLLCIYLLAGWACCLLLAAEPRLIRIRGAIPALATGALIAAVLVTIPIMLTLALAEHSNRPSIAFLDAAAGSLHPALLITGLTPHLFGAAGEMRDYWGPPSFAWEGTGLYLAQNMGVIYLGALPLLLLLTGLFRGDLWHPGIRFFTVAWLLLLLYALGWYTPAFRGMYEFLPGVSFYRRPADAVFLLGGLAALMAGFVASQLATEFRGGFSVHGGSPRPAICAVLVTVLLLFCIAIGFALALGKLGQAALPLAHAALWVSLAILALGLALWLAPIRPILAATVLVALLAVDIVVNNGPNGASALPSTSLAMLRPGASGAGSNVEVEPADETINTLKRLVAQGSSGTRRDRIEMVGLGYHWPNTPMTHNLHSTLGANPVRLAHYVAATGAGDTAALGNQRAFPPLFPSYRSPLANLLGLRYILTSEPIGKIDKSLAPGALPLIARVGSTLIYENIAALPRVLFAPQMQQADFTAILSTGRWPTTEFRRTVLLQASPATTGAIAPKQQATARPGNITIRAYRNTSITLDVDSPDGGWAVLNDVWHPWWYAEVDGVPTPVLRANVMFRAVAVPPGRHTVHFRFQPLKGMWVDLFQRSGRRLDVENTNARSFPSSQGPAPSQ